MSLPDPPRCPLVSSLRAMAEWTNAVGEKATLTLCADRLEKLNALARAVFEGWPETGVEWDGGDLQLRGIEAGLLEATERIEPCGSELHHRSCVCVEEGADFSAGPVICYRRRGPIA